MTRTLSLWMSSAVAANTDFANTGGTMMPMAVAVIPLTTKSRRVIISSSSLQVKLGACEQRVPAVGVGLRGVEHTGGIPPHDAVELCVHRARRIGKAGPGGDGMCCEVESGQPRAGRHPTLVGRPACDRRHVVEHLVHARARGDTARR